MSAYDGYIAYQNFFENHKPARTIIHHSGQFYNKETAKIIQKRYTNHKNDFSIPDGKIKLVEAHYVGQFPPPDLEKSLKSRQRGGAMSVKDIENDIVKKIEQAGREAFQKLGMSGKGLHGEGIFDTIKKAIKKAPQAFMKALDVKPTDTAIEAFVKGLKSPITLGEKFEKATGISIPEASEKLAPLLASAAALQPELAPILLPASAAIIAGGEAFRVAEGIDKKVLKPVGL